MDIPQSDAFVFFGATGDLAFKKIFPALQAMIKHGQRFLVAIDAELPIHRPRLAASGICRGLVMKMAIGNCGSTASGNVK
jgi:hypothetical protein